MPWIAVDTDLGLLYEGGIGYGRQVVPTPSTAPAFITPEHRFTAKLPPSYNLAQADFLFREDSFDPVSRIRRGRPYFAAPARPAPWLVAHPSGVNDTRSVYPFQPLHVPQRLDEIRKLGDQPLIVIGTDASFTIWTIAFLL